MIPQFLATYMVFLVMVVGFIALTFKIVPEYQRLVVFFLGR